MKTSILLIRIGGVVNLLVAALHIGFWKLFDWPVELTKISVDTSNILQMLNLFSIVFFFYTAGVLIFKPRVILTSEMGRAFLGMLGTMYLARLAMEFYFPQGSLGFAAFLLVVVLLFTIPLFHSKRISHAHQ